MPPGLIADMFTRLAISAAAGISPIKAWRSEAERLPPRWGQSVGLVASALAAGESIDEAIRSAGETFPPDVRAMISAGDRTGRDAEVFREIADSNRLLAQAMTRFQHGLIWPAFQLVVAVAVLGLLIVVSGPSLDLLGLGLTGKQGLAIYVAAVVAIACMVAVVLWAIRASWRRSRILYRTITAIPVISGTLRAWELAAWCRAASLTASIGMDAGRLVRLAGEAAPNLACDDRGVVAALAAGATLAEALERQNVLGGALGRRVLVAIDVGEQSGTTGETLGKLSEHLFQEASDGLLAIAGWAGRVVWAVVAVLVATIVFRVVGSYANLLHDLSRSS